MAKRPGTNLRGKRYLRVESEVHLRPVDPQAILARARKLRSQVRGKMTEKDLRQLKMYGRP